MSKQTLAIIKPDAVQNQYHGQIIDRVIREGFSIKAMKLVQLKTEDARQFYAVHKERPFYNDLVKFMTSGPVIPMILEKDNAVENFRSLIGATDPAKADEGTIRKLFASSIEANAVHGSDSDENAIIESDFFFSKIERVTG